MNVNSNSSKELSTRSGRRLPARNSLPRWRMVFAALVLALTAGSVNQARGAHAATGSEEKVYVAFTLEVAPENDQSMCPKQNRTFHVSVSKEKIKTINGKDFPIPDHIGGSPDATAEVLSGPGKLLSALSDGSDTAVFTFTAGAKDTVLRFKVNIKPAWIGKNEENLSKPWVEKKVNIHIKCNFKATTTGAWHVPGPANIFVAATSGDANVQMSDTDGALTGSTSVNWVGSLGQAEDCSGAITIGSSRVDWTGVMDDSGQLTLNGTYQPAAGSVDIHCVGSSGETVDGSTPVELTPDPLQITLASAGGVFTQSQTLEGPEATPGKVTIIVFPEENAAATIIPNNYTADLSNLSNLFGSLLAWH